MGTLLDVRAGQLQAFEQILHQAGFSDRVVAAVLKDPKKARELAVMAERLFLTPEWSEEDGIVYFLLMSDNTSGPNWVERLWKKCFKVEVSARRILFSPEFRPTSGVHKIAVIGGALFEDNERTTKNICEEALRRGFSGLGAEAACMIRESFSDEDMLAMGFKSITVMQDPNECQSGRRTYLHVDSQGSGRWLNKRQGGPKSRWSKTGGFAFLDSQQRSS